MNNVDYWTTDNIPSKLRLSARHDVNVTRKPREKDKRRREKGFYCIISTSSSDVTSENSKRASRLVEFESRLFLERRNAFGLSAMLGVAVC